MPLEKKGRTPSLGRTGRRCERGVDRVDLFEVCIRLGSHRQRDRTAHVNRKIYRAVTDGLSNLLDDTISAYPGLIFSVIHIHQWQSSLTQLTDRIDLPRLYPLEPRGIIILIVCRTRQRRSDRTVLNQRTN